MDTPPSSPWCISPRPRIFHSIPMNLIFSKTTLLQALNNIYGSEFECERIREELIVTVYLETPANLKEKLQQDGALLDDHRLTW
ncbi:hypothetical protein ACJZ2D_000042 [Fusarium nematophilum]